MIATANHGWEAARLRSSGDSRTSSSTRHILKDSSGFLRVAGSIPAGGTHKTTSDLRRRDRAGSLSGWSREIRKRLQHCDTRAVTPPPDSELIGTKEPDRRGSHAGRTRARPDLPGRVVLRPTVLNRGRDTLTTRLAPR